MPTPIEPPAVSPASVASSDVPVSPAAAVSAPAILWETAYPLWTNRYFVRDVAKMFMFAWVGTLLLIVVPVIVVGDIDEAPGVAAGITVLIVGLALLAGGLMAVTSRDRFAVTFGVSLEGAAWRNHHGPADAMANIAMLGGVLSANPAVATSGAAARHVQRGSVRWADVVGIEEDAARCVLTLKKKRCRIAFRLYCTPENYDQVRSFVTARHGGQL